VAAAPASGSPQSQRGSSIDPRVAEQVRAEQVRTLYRQSTPVLLANVFNAIVISAALWSYAPHARLLAWTGCMTAMALARVELRRRYWSRERAAAEHARWGLRFTLGSLSAGCLWGFAGFALMPSALPLQVLVLFVVGGMAAAAAGTISCFMPAYYAYLLPSLTPAIARLWLFGGTEHADMVAILLLFVFALSLVAHNVHRALAEAFSLRFENTELLTQVSNAHASVTEANANLRIANEQLETRVRERTLELQESQANLSEIVNESPDAIVVMNELGVIVAANPASERISGQPARALIGRHFTDTGTAAPDDIPRALEAFKNALAGSHRPLEEFRLVRPDGQQVVIEVMLRAVRGRDGEQRVHSVIRDVSERHRMQRLKQAYEERLREAERLEAVGLLAGGVAHDFNNVLTTILGNVDLLETSGADPNAKALLGEIRHGALQAANLTRQLLAFSRKQVLDVKPADLGYVISNAQNLFERALGEQNRLEVSLPAQPMVVLVDATQIEQAILNLLVNARHAMPEGGRVALQVEHIELDSANDWPEAEPGAYVRLAVTDTGTGMDEATRRRVFEPFFTTKELGHGTGLGLSSVHGVVKQAGGHIHVLSEPGLGTRFEILLPYHAAPAPQIARQESTAWRAGAGTVLVVEDQTQVRRALAYLLEGAGYSVITAENAEAALEIVRKCDGRVDLLVSDVIMPGVSGIELSRRLLAMYPRLAVLLVSGYAGSELGDLAELGDDVVFLQKPFDAVSLTSAVSAALARARSEARALRTAGSSDAG
jgi:PAS domain S-box-containing protein